MAGCLCLGQKIKQKRLEFTYLYNTLFTRYFDIFIQILVLIWCTWLPQSVNAATVARLDTNVHAPEKHVEARASELRSHGASYRQADYDYDEEENEDEETEEELEAAISDGTKLGGANVEAEGEEEEEEDYEEEYEDSGGEVGRALKRKYLVEKFMGLKVL